VVFLTAGLLTGITREFLQEKFLSSRKTAAFLFRPDVIAVTENFAEAKSGKDPDARKFFYGTADFEITAIRAARICFF
jgi:hypothetical protein